MPVLKTNMSHKILLRYKKVFFKLTLLRYRFHVGDPLVIYFQIFIKILMG